MSIDTKPKWTRQQWRNFIDTRDIDLSRPYSEYCLIGIEPSVQVNLQPNVPASLLQTNYQLIKKIQKTKLTRRTTRMELRSRKKFNNLLQSPLLQSQRRLHQPQASLELWLEAALMCLVKSPLVMIHLLLCLWPVCQSLEQRKSPTKKLGLPIWPQQLGFIQEHRTTVGSKHCSSVSSRPKENPFQEEIVHWSGGGLSSSLHYSLLGTKIVFEEFGLMAGELSYQHVVIPLNLTSLIDQANSLEGIIQFYTDQIGDTYDNASVYQPTKDGKGEYAYMNGLINTMNLAGQHNITNTHRQNLKYLRSRI